MAYDTAHGSLGRVLELSTAAGFRVDAVRVLRGEASTGVTSARLRLAGSPDIHALVADLAELDGVREIDLGSSAYATE